MVASRKTTAKSTKTSTPRKVVKSAVKKAPVKKTARKSTKTAAGEMKSFRVAKNDTPFTTFRVTRQTLYWVVLVAFIIFAQLWIISLQVEVASLIDAQQAQLQNY